MTDEIVERAQKIGRPRLRSISDVSRHQRLEDNNDESVPPKKMLAELDADNQKLRLFRSAHETYEKYKDGDGQFLIEVWIDHTERRTWFLSEIVHGALSLKRVSDPFNNVFEKHAPYYCRLGKETSDAQ
jgi:starvation-inducible DNA-binding protein